MRQQISPWPPLVGDEVEASTGEVLEVVRVVACGKGRRIECRNKGDNKGRPFTVPRRFIRQVTRKDKPC